MGSADSRPRVHVWAHGTAVGWSHGPHGIIHPAPSVGAAVDEALGELDERPAVIIWMGREHEDGR